MGALDFDQFAWIGFLVAGIIGAILLITVFEWALIGISSLLGATIVADGFGDDSLAFPVFLGCLFVGIVAQALQYRSRREVETAPAPGSGRPG